MADPNIEILKRDTYKRMIENSPGSKIFKSLFVRFKDSGEVKDILNDGEKSCAVFVTGILTICSILDRPSATVESTRKRLLEKVWEKVPGKPELGDVIFWEKKQFEVGAPHEHVGFALNDTEAVSSDWIKKEIAKHDITYDGTRKVELVLRAPESKFK